MQQNKMQNKLVDDRYRIISRIGQGAMGMVFSAEHVYTKRPVALKVIHSQYQENELYRVRFLREIELACRVHHPNAVQIFDAGQLESGMLYMAMEYLEGVTLSHLLRQAPKGLELQTVLHIAWQISQALDAVHNAGLVHRDLKPDNIMVQVEPEAPLDTCTAKILDFGIAHDVDTMHSLTGKSMIGTPKFMSPEQTRGEKLTQKSDIYNLGLIVYAMLTGKEPFTSDSPVGYVFHHNMTAPPPVSSERSDITASVEWAIQKALSKDPAERFDTAAEFMDALVGIGPASRNAGRTADRSAETPPRRKRLRNRAGAVAVLSAAIFLTMSWLLPANKKVSDGSDGALSDARAAMETPALAEAALNTASLERPMDPAGDRTPDTATAGTPGGVISVDDLSVGADTIFVLAVYAGASGEEDGSSQEASLEEVMAAVESPAATSAAPSAAMPAPAPDSEETDPNLRYYKNLRALHAPQRGAGVASKPIEENSNILRLREKQRLADNRLPEKRAEESSSTADDGPAPHALPRVQGGVETLQSRIRIPNPNMQLSGTVGVRLLIDEDGKVEAEEVVESIGYGYDEEVLRVLQTASYEPARIQNRPVKAWLSLKFKFQRAG